MALEENTINTITFFNEVEGEIFPEKDLPENARKLKGFIWRGEERIKSKEEIFPPEETEQEQKIQELTDKDNAKENVPMKIRKETLNYDKKTKK